MTCRTTPGGRVATPFARDRFRLQDQQAVNLFHRLRRHAAAQGETVSEEEYHEALHEIERQLPRLGLSAAQENRARGRIREALAAPMPDAADAWATTHMPQHANEAARAQDSVFLLVAQRTSTSVSHVRDEFLRLYAETPTVLRSRDHSVYGQGSPRPSDYRTQYAFETLWGGARCEACGQFLSTSRAAPFHDCPNAVSTQQEPSSTANAEVNGERQESSASTGTSVSQVESVAQVDPLSTPTMSIEDFQELYDQAKANLRAGQRDVPSFPEWESQPGAVTGGLAGEGGTTFGLEIEIDFPDDTYPYSKRDEFARMLFNEGIALQPEVSRWHYLGEEGANRPGGTFQETHLGWSVEYDRSVDDVGGHRGLEIKSQILRDTPDTWRTLRRICEVGRELGGKATKRTGVHVNIGSNWFPKDDPSTHLRLLRLMRTFDDTLIRLAHNPEIGPRHRGRQYCSPVSDPPSPARGMRVYEAKSYGGHYHSINLDHLPDEYTSQASTSRVEFRPFDSSMDVGRIQMQTAISLGLAAAAHRGEEPLVPERLAGSTGRDFGRRALTGVPWEQATEPTRRLIRILQRSGLNSQEHLKQLSHMFAESKWPYA